MKRLTLVFWLSCMALLGVSVLVPLREYFSEWRRAQRSYNRLAKERQNSRSPVKPVSLGIRQVWSRELGYVDRCTTCHLGIENTSLRDAPEPFRAHPAAPHKRREMGCTVCHRGQGLATTGRAAHGRLDSWDDAMLPSPYLEASCGRCHLGETVPESPVLSAGRLLIQKAGCAGCHKIAIPPARVPIGPNLDGIGSKVNAIWLFRWLKNPKDYLERTYMPNLLLPDGDARLLTLFLMAQKAPIPETSIPSDPGAIEKGQFQFRQFRCISCHSQNGRGGTFSPDLGRIGGKARPAWMAAWLKDPKALFPETRMPRFRLPDAGIETLVAYMAAEFADSSTGDRANNEFVRTLPPATPGNLAAGRKLLLRSGCMGCHTLKGVEEQPKLGPDLAGIGSRTIDRLDFGPTTIERTLWSWLSTKLKTPRAFGRNLRMGDFRFTEDQIRQIVTALLSYTESGVPPRYVTDASKPPPERPQGAFGRILERYQCLSCHRIRGEGGTIGPDLSIIGSQAKPQWLAEYFRLPYSQRPNLKERMLLLGLSDEEIEAAVTYFRVALLDDSIPREVFPEGRPAPEEVARGQELFFNTYACQACHQVNLAGGYVGPPLDGIGRRLYSGYLFAYVRSPQRFKPGFACPEHKMPESDALAIAAYLVSLPPAKAGRAM